MYAAYYERLGGLSITATYENSDGSVWEDITLFTLQGIYSTGTYRFSSNKGYDGDGPRILCFYNKANWSCKGYYHDSLNTSELNITFYDTINHIISGTFVLDVINRDCEDSIMHITDGRFDVRYN